MKSFSALAAVAVIAIYLLLSSSSVSGFTPATGRALTSRTRSTELFFFFGPKDDGSPGDYVCMDCGYVFTKGPKAWAELPDSWSCPPCGSVKRRFKKVPKGSATGKVEVKKKGK